MKTQDSRSKTVFDVTREEWIEEAVATSALTRLQLQDATCRPGWLKHGFLSYGGVIRVGKAVVWGCNHRHHTSADDARQCAFARSGLKSYRGRVLGIYMPTTTELKGKNDE